jgi:hypothetical protein
MDGTNQTKQLTIKKGSSHNGRAGGEGHPGEM